MSDNKNNAYNEIFNPDSYKEKFFILKIILVIYYFTLNTILILIITDLYYEFMSESGWFMLALFTLMLNNVCQFIKYLCIYT